jgi:hypothetical protein
VLVDNRALQGRRPTLDIASDAIQLTQEGADVASAAEGLAFPQT